jgi:hypothetical protein
VASLLSHLRNSPLKTQVLLFGAEDDERTLDAEWIAWKTALPYLTVSQNGICNVSQKSFYGKKAEIFAFATRKCRERLNANQTGWIVLLEDDVVASEWLGTKLAKVFTRAQQVEARVMKLFSPDAYQGWGFSNVKELLQYSLLLSAVILLLVVLARKWRRRPFRRKKGWVLALIVLVSVGVFLLSLAFVRIIPRQLWEVLLPYTGDFQLRRGTLGHASQAFAVRGEEGQNLENFLCNSARHGVNVNQDILFWQWTASYLNGHDYTCYPSIFQHIGFATPLKRPHAGWKLSDITFGTEFFPK